MVQQTITIPRIGYEREFNTHYTAEADFILPAQRHILPARQKAAELIADTKAVPAENFLSYAEIAPYLVYIPEEQDWTHVGWVVTTFGI